MGFPGERTGPENLQETLPPPRRPHRRHRCGRRRTGHRRAGAEPGGRGHRDAGRHGMRTIAGLVEEGRLRTGTAGTFPRAQAARAHEPGETDRTTGKPALPVE
ncbi:zinc-binding dehydrogenase [Streptomyces thermovulgaris]|uniref:zinc-binding dehydrogenase n=1 Tax=Streptomyces TaxID=1883 RepID=UPI003CCBCF13